MKGDNRTIIKVPLNKHVETLMAYTYGHTIPIRSELEETNNEKLISLRIDDSVPAQVIEQAKQVCVEGSNRYYTNVLNRTNEEQNERGNS